MKTDRGATWRSTRARLRISSRSTLNARAGACVLRLRLFEPTGVRGGMTRKSRASKELSRRDNAASNNGRTYARVARNAYRAPCE